MLFVYVSFLVGIGAQQWALSHGIPPCPSEKMATSEYFNPTLCVFVFLLPVLFLITIV